MDLLKRHLPPLMTAEQVSAQTTIPKHRVYELARLDLMPHVRLGRSMRFDPQAVRRWLDEGGTR